MRILSKCILGALISAGTLGALPVRPIAAQDSRSESQLAEDQALLKRQLTRLRQTMEVLAKRFEDEGRTHAATLLRDGLKQLDTRPEDVGSRTIEELMAAAQENLEGGRSVQSVEAQEAAVRSLERLYSILTDRRGLEDLQKSLADLRDLRKQLGALAGDESKLREETRELRERAATPAQKELQQAIDKAIAAQRSLLERTQAEARATNDLDLAALERELEALLADQRADAGVLAAWKPEESAALEAATRAAQEAASPAARAQRLAQAAAELRAAARSARTPGSDLSEAQRALERAAEREERHARAANPADPAASPEGQAAGDPTARRAAEALAKGVEAVREASAGRSSRPEAADRLEAEARALEAQASTETQAAEAARAAAESALAKLADPNTSAGSAAQAAREALERAGAARAASTTGREGANGAPQPEPTAESAQRAEQAAAEAQRATLEAARALQRGVDDQRRIAPILAQSQRDAAERAANLARAMRSVPGEGAAEREQAGAEMEAAARAQREASTAAESTRSSQAAEAANEAVAALERAQSAMQSARAARAQAAQGAQAGAQSALQQEQEALARQTEALEQAAREAGLEKESQRAAESALKSAQEAMRQASAQMGASESSQASSSQSQALERLQAASEAARAGSGRPQTPADQAEAQRLKEEQARIRAELLKLAEKNRQREGAKPSKSMESASRSAQRAEDELGGGDLSAAEEAEAETERQLREAERELGQEEEQYQRLRQEELLFKIAEQVKTLQDEHAAQMRATTEVDSQRKPGDRPSHIARQRMRKIGKAEEQLGSRSTEIADAIRAEQSFVFAELLDQAARDLGVIARDLSEEGDWQSGERVQARQQDVEQSLAWLAEALQQEKQRRQQEQQQPQEGQQQPPPRDRLVPDVAELKLLRRVGVDVTDEIERLRILHPEIEEGGEIDPLLREEIARLGFRHERVSEMFRQFRARLGIPASDEEKP